MSSLTGRLSSVCKMPDFEALKRAQLGEKSTAYHLTQASITEKHTKREFDPLPNMIIIKEMNEPVHRQAGSLVIYCA